MTSVKSHKRDRTTALTVFKAEDKTKSLCSNCSTKQRLSRFGLFKAANSQRPEITTGNERDEHHKHLNKKTFNQ